MYYDYPLEQGLRQKPLQRCCLRQCEYYDYPLEQGLRPKNIKTAIATILSIMIIH